MRNACSWKAPLVTLVDGRQVPSDHPEWKDECEARHVLSIPTKAARLELLAAIEKKRGKDAADDLRRRVLLLWEMTKNKRGEAA